jgi:flavodoxin I
MNILILYETYSSSTETVAYLIAETINASGSLSEVKKLTDVETREYSDYDLVIFSTPSWYENGTEGQPHTNFLKFMEINSKASFVGLNCVFVGLGDSTYNKFCNAIEIVERFFTDRGANVTLPTLKLDRYFVNTDVEKEKLTSWTNKLLSNPGK